MWITINEVNVATLAAAMIAHDRPTNAPHTSGAHTLVVAPVVRMLTWRMTTVYTGTVPRRRFRLDT